MLQASIIIPTLNEAENIGPLLTRLENVLNGIEGDVEILFVDNSSTDGTAEEVERYAFSDKVRVYRNPINEGLAKAVLAGVDHVKNDCIVVMDADLSHPPEAVPELLRALVDGKNDMVIGSRYVKGGSTPDWPLSRKFMSKLATLPARMFCDVHDPLAGFFAVRRKFLLASKDKVKGFKLGFELLSLDEKEFRVKEVPIVFHDRECGCSKMCFNVIADYFQQLVQTAGGDVTFARHPRFLSTTFAAVLLDFILCYFFLNGGMTLASTHMLGLALSSSLLYVTTRSWHVKNSIAGAPFLQSRLTRLTLLTLFVMAMRGGFITFGTLVLGASIWSSFTVAILVSHFLNFLGNVLFVFPGSYFRFNQLINWRIFSVVAFAYLLVLRFLFLGTHELRDMEAYYWHYAQQINMGYWEHPPMAAVLVWVSTLLFGDNEFGVRIGGYFISGLGLFFIYRLAVESKGRSVGLAVLLLMSAFPLYYGTPLFMTSDVTLTAFWAGTLYFLYRILILGKNDSWIGFSLCFGLGMVSNYHLALLGPAGILFMLFDRKSRRWFIRPHLYLSVIFVVILFSSDIIGQSSLGGGFAFQGLIGVNDLSLSSLLVPLVFFLVLLTPITVLGFIHFLIIGRRLADVIEEKDVWKREYLFYLLMILVPLSVFSFLLFSGRTTSNWSGPLWLALLPYLGILMTSLHLCDGQDRLTCYFKKSSPALIAFFALLLSFLPHYFSLGLPWVPVIQSTFSGGWKDLAGQVEKKVQAMEKNNGSRSIVVGMDEYQIASSLGFYRNSLDERAGVNEKTVILQETRTWSVLGYNSMMDEFRYNPEDNAGRDLLIVASQANRADENVLQRYGVYRSCGPLETVNVSKNGEVFGRYFIREVESYTFTAHQ